MENKEKLFLVSPMLHQGGFERVCVTTAKLLENEFDITIVIFDDADIAYDIEGLKIVNLNCPVKGSVLGKVLNSLKRSHKLKRLKKIEKPGICYSFGLTANLVNCLSTVPEVKTWTGLRSYGDVYNERYIKLFMKKSDLVVCCAKEIEKELAQKYDYNKTATLYNLYNLDLIKKESAKPIENWPFVNDADESGNNKLRYLISMGRDDDSKGFWHMVKAFYHIHKAVPETRLIILGDGTFGESITLATKLGIRDSIYFAGMCKEPYKYLKKAEIYLLTSCVEGFPNALVEGMSLGLASVATDCLSGPREILCPDDSRCYGILLNNMTKEKNYNAEDTSEEREYADAVIDLLTNNEKLKKYQMLAVQRAADFSYESYKERFIELTKL